MRLTCSGHDTRVSGLEMEASLRATSARSSSRRLSKKKQANAGKSDTHLLQQSTAKDPRLREDWVMRTVASALGENQYGLEAFSTFSLKIYVVIYVNAVNYI